MQAGAALTLPGEALLLCAGKIRAGALRTRGTAELRSATAGKSPRVVAWIVRLAAFLANEAGQQTRRVHKVARGTAGPIDRQITIGTIAGWSLLQRNRSGVRSQILGSRRPCNQGHHSDREEQGVDRSRSHTVLLREAVNSLARDFSLLPGRQNASPRGPAWITGHLRPPKATLF